MDIPTRERVNNVRGKGKILPYLKLTGIGGEACHIVRR